MLYKLLATVLTNVAVKFIGWAISTITEYWEQKQQEQEGKETMDEIMSDEDRERAAARLNSMLNGL